jgi:hypothetical protein
VVYDSERERRNDAVVEEHKQALAWGEKRVLRRTAAGELHSYAAEEIGFTPGRGQVQVITWWGMGIVTAVLWAGFVFSWVLFFAPVVKGEPPMWGALFLTAMGGLFGWYTFGMARDEYRATKLRKERGVPKPGSSGHLPL